MEYSPRQLSYGGGAARSHASMLPIRADWNAPASVQRDLSVARLTKANLLLVGADRLVAKVLPFAVPELTQAAISRCKDGSLRLPSPSMGVSTIVVRDVDALTHGEQRSFREWLESQSTAVHVVSTASAPVLPLVETGEFSAALYYRLNMVYIDLSA